jgi:hypothetical protein
MYSEYFGVARMDSGVHSMDSGVHSKMGPPKILTQHTSAQ